MIVCAFGSVSHVRCNTPATKFRLASDKIVNISIHVCHLHFSARRTFPIFFPFKLKGSAGNAFGGSDIVTKNATFTAADASGSMTHAAASKIHIHTLRTPTWSWQINSASRPRPARPTSQHPIILLHPPPSHSPSHPVIHLSIQTVINRAGELAGRLQSDQRTMHPWQPLHCTPLQLPMMYSGKNHKPFLVVRVSRPHKPACNPKMVAHTLD